MLLSTTIEALDKKIGQEAAIKLLAETGFDAYDMSFMYFNGDFDFELDDAFMSRMRGLRKFADSLGIVCNQAHAPFHTSYGDEVKDKKRYGQIVKSIEAASILGAKIIVVHPIQHLKYSENVETLREMNIEFYKSLVPYCEKFGIKVATENMWQYDGHIVDSTCSKPEEFCDYVDSIGSEWIVACLDLGHVPLVDTDMVDMIHKLGNRLCALHVHDNDLKNDSHTLPFTMKMDFDIITNALSDINYKGDFTYEAGSFFNRMPNELLPSTLRLMHDVGRYLMSRIEK